MSMDLVSDSDMVVPEEGNMIILNFKHTNEISHYLKKARLIFHHSAKLY